MEKIIVDSGLLRIPVGVVDRLDPDKVHDFLLTVDISDKSLKEMQEQTEITKLRIEKLGQEYAEKFGDAELTDENAPQVIEALAKPLRISFDADFGTGMYDEIANAGGGNSFANMWELYSRVNDYISREITRKFQKIAQKSKNKKAKYLKNRKR